MPSARLIGVGTFVLGGFLLFALGIFMIGDRRLLFADQFDVYAEFEQVAGLQDGAPVRVNGMDAGEVTDMTIPASPAGRFRVRMRVRNDLGPLVRTDSVASIRTDGLVGSRYVHIQAGSAKAPAATDGGSIASREPFDFADLLEQGTRTIDNVNATITELRSHMNEVVSVISETATNANEVVKTAAQHVEAISRAGRRISEDSARIVEGIRAGRGTVGKLVNDDALYEKVTNIATDAEQAAKTARAAAESARTAIEGLKGGPTSEGPLQSIARDLKQTLASTRDTMSNLADNTEALKRSFLVRGYFRERGYYDLDAITAVDYRQGALAGEHREPIRIWLRGDLLFETAAAGVPVPGAERGGVAGASAGETLSEDGRARLDRAMAEVLRYPKDTPLIIEGYAEGITRDVRFLRSTQRAHQVREYLIARYGVAPTRVGTMPLGNDAPDSPSGAAWDGVSLAMWVDRRVLHAATVASDPRP